MPAKAAEREGRLHPTSVRLTAELRRQLEAAASAAGRSLSQEIEQRLERSFYVERVISQTVLGIEPLISASVEEGLKRALAGLDGRANLRKAEVVNVSSVLVPPEQPRHSPTRTKRKSSEV
ncbi:MAG TPA: Arc family DNA-binding protein [Microvirga sp.]|jgi:predicted transcriptional regulator|nr:Arc family DNA-binding protein [Microvirga sp.]